MDTTYCILRSFLFVHCVGVVLSASYYQREYSRYLFTIPGFNDAERRSQVDAQKWCNGNGSKLLAITNQGIQDAAVAFINQAIRDNQMTGNNIITDGKRTDGGWTWINQTTMINLAIGGQEGGLNKSYAFLYVPPLSSALTLLAGAANETRYFICEGQVFCGTGYLIQGQCFQSIRDDNQVLSWFEARNVCLQRGGDLATFEFITSKDGLNMLNNGSWLIPSSQYWIGLRRQWWTWQSINSNATYSQWSVGHPIYDVNQQCICLLPNTPVNDWKWSECECNQVFQFVCISSPGTVNTTSSTTTSTLTRQSLSTTTSSTTTTTQSDPQDENSTGICSHLGVGLGVGLGIGIPLLLIIIALIIVVIQLKRKLRNNEASSGNKVEMTVTPAYESLHNGTTTHSSTYQELNITN